MRHAGSWLVTVVVCVSAAGWPADAFAQTQIFVSSPAIGTPDPAPLQTTGDGVIVGRVLEVGTDRPIAGATVTLGQTAAAPGRSQAPASRTTADGYFMLRELPAGQYNLVAQAPGFVAGQYGQQRLEGPMRVVTLQTSERLTDLVMRLARTGAISGRVLDDAGEPVVGAQVRGLRRDGRGQVGIASTARTDDRGVYRLYGLTPGEYVLMIPQTIVSFPTAMASAVRDFNSPSSSDLRRDLGPSAFSMTAPTIDAGSIQIAASGGLADTPAITVGSDGRMQGSSATFAPDAATVASAEILAVASGQDRTGVDIRLRFTPLFRVSGVAAGPDGPLPNLGLRLLPATASLFQTDYGIDTAATTAGPDGQFTFVGVPPGEYELRVVRSPAPTGQASSAFETVITSTRGVAFFSGGPSDAPLPKPPGGPTYWAAQAVAVAGRDVDGVVVTLRQGVHVSGRVEFDGQAPAAADRARTGVSLAPADDRAAALSLQSPIDDAGHFETAQGVPGRYVINVTGLPRGWTIAAAEAAGVNLLEHALALDAADVTDVVVTVSQKNTAISGTVRGSGTGDPHATVVAFPADYESWIADGMTSRRLRTVNAGSNGGYELAGLTPGRYALVAVPATADVDPRNPATIAALARVATRVSVAPGETKTVALDVSRIP